MTTNKLPRMDNIGIVVQDLKASVSFFEELGLELEGEMTAEGDWVERIIALDGVRMEIAMMSTPDGNSRLELMKFVKPAAIASELKAPVNALGIRRIMFAVTNMDDVIGRLQKHGAELVGEIVRYGDTYRLCYLRGPDGIILALAEQLGDGSAAEVPILKKSSLLRMDNILIVVDDLEEAKAFFAELGLDFEGEPVVEGPSVDSLLGLNGVRATLSIMRTPDGHSLIELDKFHSPPAVNIGSADADVNTIGIRRIMFAVSDIDVVVGRLRTRGASLVGEIVRFEDAYRLCYVRSPEGIIIGLAEQL